LDSVIFLSDWFYRKIQFSIKRSYQLRGDSPSTGRRIHALMRERIRNGALPPGEKLPSTRALAAELGVSRSTVVAIYEQLACEGYIETAAGARARVSLGVRVHAPTARQPAGEPATPAPALSSYGRRIRDMSLPQRAEAAPRHINFLYGAIADDDFPKLAWRRLYNKALTRRQHCLYYGAAEGEADLRRELQGYLLRARGLSCTAEQILIVQGTQQALDLCAKVLIDPGQSVVMEEPGYLMARSCFESIGARIIAAPVDDQGLVTSALPRTGAALAYVTPSHQFPRGAVMSISRRQALLAWAQRHASWVIEDDYDSEFRYGLRPVDTLKSLDRHDSVIYIGTFSKALSPQLRLGYLVLPPALVAPLRRAKQLADRHPPMLEQMVLAELIRSGAYERHLRRLRRANERRRAALIAALAAHLGAAARIEGTDSGLHVVLWAREVPLHAELAVVRQARAMGVGIWPVSPLYAEGPRFRDERCAGFVLGYAGLGIDDIKTGIHRLAEAINQNAEQPS
jgi:GntR family transcriptional regulator/MocR family aminotransferase